MTNQIFAIVAVVQESVVLKECAISVDAIISRGIDKLPLS